MQRASVRVCVCLTLSRSVTREEPAVREAKFTSNVRYPLPQIPPTPTGDRAAELVARVAVKHDVVLRFAITITGKCQWLAMLHAEETSDPSRLQEVCECVLRFTCDHPVKRRVTEEVLRESPFQWLQALELESWNTG